MVDTSYGLGKYLGDCRPALPKGRKYQMVKTQTESKLGVGVAMTRDPATLMVGQYFKRKRELVEIFLVSGSGLGIATMSVFIKTAIR